MIDNQFWLRIIRIHLFIIILNEKNEEFDIMLIFYQWDLKENLKNDIEKKDEDI